MERQDWTQNFFVAKGKPKETPTISSSSGTGLSFGGKKPQGKDPRFVPDDIMKSMFHVLTSDEKVDHDLSLSIQQGRNSKGWTQVEFAQRLCVKPDIVKNYENGTAIPDNAFIAKMERLLGVKLPRHVKGSS